MKLEDLLAVLDLDNQVDIDENNPEIDAKTIPNHVEYLVNHSVEHIRKPKSINEKI